MLYFHQWAYSILWSFWYVYKGHFMLHFYFPINEETIRTTVFQIIAIPAITSFAVKSTNKLGKYISYMFISKALISKCLLAFAQRKWHTPPHGGICVLLCPFPSHLLVLLGFVPSFFKIKYLSSLLKVTCYQPL